jgi:hypothetical protein
MPSADTRDFHGFNRDRRMLVYPTLGVAPGREARDNLLMPIRSGDPNLVCAIVVGFNQVRVHTALYGMLDWQYYRKIFKLRHSPRSFLSMGCPLRVRLIIVSG